MSPENIAIIEQRKAAFQGFYAELMPALVDFIGRIGINPAHHVLNQAKQYAAYVEQALQDMSVTNDEDRTWLLTRVGYYVGEYFAQKFGGAWYVNDIEGSRYFGRYVVGKFEKTGNLAAMIDPFEIAQAYVDNAVPRKLTTLLSEVESELVA